MRPPEATRRSPQRAMTPRARSAHAVRSAPRPGRARTGSRRPRSACRVFPARGRARRAAPPGEHDQLASRTGRPPRRRRGRGPRAPGARGARASGSARERSRTYPATSTSSSLSDRPAVARASAARARGAPRSRTALTTSLTTALAVDAPPAPSPRSITVPARSLEMMTALSASSTSCEQVPGSRPRWGAREGAPPGSARAPRARAGARGIPSWASAADIVAGDARGCRHDPPRRRDVDAEREPREDHELVHRVPAVDVERWIRLGEAAAAARRASALSKVTPGAAHLREDDVGRAVDHAVERARCDRRAGSRSSNATIGSPAPTARLEVQARVVLGARARKPRTRRRDDRLVGGDHASCLRAAPTR